MGAGDAAKTTATATTASLFQASTQLIDARSADVGDSRERQRRRRLRKLVVFVGLPAAYLWYRILDDRPVNFFQLPHIDWLLINPIIFFILLPFVLVGKTICSGRTRHVVY